MKIQKIISLIKKTKRICLACKDGMQWIGDGSAFYAIHSLPELDEDGIFAMADIPEDKRGSYTFEFIGWLPIFDEDYVHEVAERLGDMLYTYHGRTMAPFSCSDGSVYMIDVKYLKPIDIDFYGYGTACVCKSKDDEPIILIKDGFITLAAIVPVKAGSAFIEEIKEMAAKLRTEEVTLGIPPEDWQKGADNAEV